MARDITPASGGAGSSPAGNPADFVHVDTIVLDLDDTIVAGTPAVLAYIETIYEGLHRETRLPREQIAKGFQAIRGRETYMFSWGFNEHGPLREKYPHGDLNERFRHIGDAAEKAFRDALTPDPDFMAALGQWHSQGYKLIMLTEGPGSATMHKLEAIGLADKLDGVAVVAERMPQGVDSAASIYPSKLWSNTIPLASGFKESSERIAEALEQFGVDPKRAAMIGNRADRDLKPLAELGARTILVNHFNRRPDEAAMKKRLGQHLFAGSSLPKGAAAATSEDKGGMTPDAVLEKTWRLTELLQGPPSFRATINPAPDQPQPDQPRTSGPSHSGPARPR
jgi:FMN phosphatase YigB (HAD superfamily)